MKRADRTIASTLALSLALSGPLSAQQMSPGAADLTEAAQERLDDIVAACEETGTVPEDLSEELPVGLANALSELDCDAILEMDEAGTLSGAGNGQGNAGNGQGNAGNGQGDAGNGQGNAGNGQGNGGDAAAEAGAGVASDATTDGDAAAAAQDSADVRAENGGQGQPDADAQTGADAQAEADTQAQAAAQAETAAQAEAEADAEIDAQTETDTEAQAETDTGAQTETGTEAQTEADALTGADADAQADAEAQAETEAGTDAEAGEVSEDDLRRALEGGGDAPVDSSTGTDEAVQADAEAEGTVDAQADAEAEAGTDTQAATEEPETTRGPENLAPVDPQEQANAVAADEQESAAAAASDETGEAEMTEEVLGEADVRQSSEDFTASGEAAAAREDDDDDDDNNTLRNAALLGLGAVALSQILRGNERVVSNSGDRVVIEDQGQLRILRNDDVLLRRPGAEVQTYSYDDGSTRQVITYDDGTAVETVRAADGRVLRRTRTLPDGTEIVLFDDTQQSENVDVSQLPQLDASPRYNFRDVSEDELVAALGATAPQGINRTFSLNQIRNIDAVRELVPEIAVDTINFETGSAAIRPTEAQELATLGNAMRRIIENDPDEVFLIEGHTDAVGSAAYNLALSDRRAESVALALTEYFNVPPSNMVLQGYGESDLMVETQGAEVRNRRAAVRRITPLLR